MANRLACLLVLLASGCMDAPPQIVETDLVPSSVDPAGPHEVRAIVVDDRGVDRVLLQVAAKPDGVFRGIPMRHEEGALYRADLPRLSEDGLIGYYVEAQDVVGQVARDPEEAPHRVFAVDIGMVQAGGSPGPGPDPGADAGPDAGPGACRAELVYPTDGAALDPAEDDFDPATPGLQTPVSAVTDAPHGTEAVLIVSGAGRHTASVDAGLAEFPGVHLPEGEVTLEVRVAAVEPCSAKATVQVGKGGPGPACETDRDCGGATVCFRGACVGPTACVGLEDCPAGMVCHANVCKRPGDLPAEACRDDDDCGPGLVCAFELCTPEGCLTDEDCFSGEQCFLGECVSSGLPAPDTCSTDDDCGRGEQCLANLCVPRQCASDDDCPQGRPRCFSGFCLPFDPPVGECQTDDDCPGGQRCFLGVACLPGFLPLPDGCGGPEDCAADEDCLLSMCIQVDCRVKADCGPAEDCRFGFCIPADLPIPMPGTCGPGRPPCPDGSSCLLTVCIPDALPIPRQCNPDGTCDNPRQRCLFGLICFGF